MWCGSDDSVIIAPHSLQLTRVLLLSLSVNLSHDARRLYAASPCYRQMNIGVHTITFFLPMFFLMINLSNICMSTISVFFALMDFRTVMHSLSLYNTTSCPPSTQPNR